MGLSAQTRTVQLKRGMPMIQQVGLTISLGTKVSENPEIWSWATLGGASGASVTLIFRRGKVAGWNLPRGERLPTQFVTNAGFDSSTKLT
jgi:hypothetical protein